MQEFSGHMTPKWLCTIKIFEQYVQQIDVYVSHTLHQYLCLDRWVTNDYRIWVSFSYNIVQCLMVHAQVKMWTAHKAYSSLRFLALIKDPVAKVSLYEHGSHLESVLVSKKVF